MLILIAESKTMTPCADAVSPDIVVAHTPAFDAEAAEIMESLRGASAEELAADAKLSLPLGRRLKEMIYEFPNKQSGGRAIESFTGVVFKAFDYSSLTPLEKARADERVRLISSLYGWLRPDDIIKPYRFDFTTRLAPEGKSFAAYWAPQVTAALLRRLEETGETDVLNLLPADATRCIDLRAIAPYARVWRADFKEILPGGKTRTPNAGRLKTLRGELLRQIITDDITTPEGLTGVSSPHFAAAGTPAPDGTITFHTV